MIRDLPSVTADRMRLIDDLAVGEFQLQLIQMMENAGRCLATLARQEFLGGDLSQRHVLTLAGAGGNGGGGLVAARRLHNWGARTTTLLAVEASQLDPIAARQLETLLATGGEILGPTDRWEFGADLIIDALLGYSQSGSPRSPIDRIVKKANESQAPILSLDVPTGINPDTGEPQPPAIKAATTLALALPKTGLLQSAAKEYVGQLWLADISIPTRLYQQIKLKVPPDLFAKSDLIRL